MSSNGANDGTPASVKSPQYDVNSHAPYPQSSSQTSPQLCYSLSGNKRSAGDDNNKNDASLYSNYTNNDGSGGGPVSTLSDERTVQDNNIHPQHESQHNDISNKLLNTGLRPVIIHSNNVFWGYKEKTGRNILGKMITKLREELYLE